MFSFSLKHEPCHDLQQECIGVQGMKEVTWAPEDQWEVSGVEVECEAVRQRASHRYNHTPQ